MSNDTNNHKEGQRWEVGFLIACVVFLVFNGASLIASIQRFVSTTSENSAIIVGMVLTIVGFIYQQMRVWLLSTPKGYAALICSLMVYHTVLAFSPTYVNSLEDYNNLANKAAEQNVTPVADTHAHVIESTIVVDMPILTPTMPPTPAILFNRKAKSTLDYEYVNQWSQQNFYRHLFAIGDVNGDSYDDMGTFDDSGIVSTWFGGPNGLPTNESQSATFLADQGSIVPLCDVNDDGYADVIVAED